MTLANITDLPTEVIRTEFPQIYAQMVRQEQIDKASSDKTNVFLDQDKNLFYMQKDGSDKATRYNLIDINKAIQRPQFTDDAHLSADYRISNWGTLDDENIFDSTNQNWDKIKDYFQAMTRKINAQTDFIVAIGPYLDELAKKKDVDLSEIVADGVDGYYKKSDIDEFENDIRRRMKNIENRFPDYPDPNGYRPPNYTGNYSNNDSETDAKLLQMKKEIEEANK